MFGTVLSVLLMGMVPVFDAPMEEAAIHALPVASPSPVTGQEMTQADLGHAVTASGIVLLDLQSGQELYARNATLRRPMGSLTKLMTALVIVEHHTLDEVATVPKDIGLVEGSKVFLPPGAKFTVGDLLSALLMASANDAARTLAVFHSGTEAAFVRQMNARAQVLGLRQTSFANAAGLDAPSQLSTPRDIALLALYVFRQPAIRERMSLPSTVIHAQGGRAITITHTHTLLHEQSDVIAGKTGTTVGAKECLLSIVREAGRDYAVVLLGSRERYVDMRAVLKTLHDLFV